MLLNLQRKICPTEKFYEHSKKLEEEICLQDIVNLITHISENYTKFITTPNPLDDLNNTDLLKMLIGHFMKLFNVDRIGAVFTRMHDVYAKFYEYENASRFRTLRKSVHLNLFHCQK